MPLRARVFYNFDMNTRQYPPVVAQTDRCLGDLVSAVRAAIQRRADWATTADLVADQMRLRMPAPEILTAEQRYGDPERYCCHLLHAEPDGSFSVVALVWRPGQATQIHDHITWCVIGVIQGTERETRYLVRDDGWLEEAGSSVNVAGEVASLAPPGDIHKVHNDGPQTAISLHIYGTDVSRLGSSVRRVYDLPVLAGI